MSISAPAKKVKIIPPKFARYIIHSSVLSPRFPEIAPKRISIIATDIPILNEIRLEVKTNKPTISGVKSAFMLFLLSDIKFEVIEGGL